MQTFGTKSGADYRVQTAEKIQHSTVYSVHPNSLYYVVDVSRSIGNANHPYMVATRGAAVFIDTRDVVGDPVPIHTPEPDDSPVDGPMGENETPWDDDEQLKADADIEPDDPSFYDGHREDPCPEQHHWS